MSQLDSIEKTLKEILEFLIIKQKMDKHTGRWSWLDGEWDYHQMKLDELKRQLPDIEDAGNE